MRTAIFIEKALVCLFVAEFLLYTHYIVIGEIIS